MGRQCFWFISGYLIRLFYKKTNGPKWRKCESWRRKERVILEYAEFHLFYKSSKCWFMKLMSVRKWTLWTKAYNICKWCLNAKFFLCKKDTYNSKFLHSMSKQWTGNYLMAYCFSIEDYPMCDTFSPCLCFFEDVHTNQQTNKNTL